VGSENVHSPAEVVVVVASADDAFVDSSALTLVANRATSAFCRAAPALLYRCPLSSIAMIYLVTGE
jgi:predicted alpha/beta hydrolase family esterase